MDKSAEIRVEALKASLERYNDGSGTNFAIIATADIFEQYILNGKQPG